MNQYTPQEQMMFINQFKENPIADWLLSQLRDLARPPELSLYGENKDEYTARAITASAAQSLLIKFEYEEKACIASIAEKRGLDNDLD